jgi:preprotein translocase subunit SecY
MTWRAKLMTFVRAFRQRDKWADLRPKLLFTVAMVVLFRFGSYLPVPGISEANVRYCSGLQPGSGTDGPLAIINVLSGNSLLRLSVFGPGIMPYITASIIIQLLTQVIPRLQALKQEGQAGTAKITQYTRYLTVGLAVLESAGYIELARSGSLFSGSGCSATSYPLIPHPSLFTLATMTCAMVSGTAVIMWMGELITDRGIGNGMSIVLFTSVLAVIPGELDQIYLLKGFAYAVMAVIVIICVVGFVVFMEQAQRRIPVQYARRMVGRRMYGGTATYLPMKVNQAGVVPVMFASSMLYMPQLAVSLLGSKDHPQAWVNWVDRYLSTATASTSYVYDMVFFLLIVAFTCFYVTITFNAAEVADSMKKYGGFIPGIRPGQPTAEYLSYVLTRLTAVGAAYLALIAMFPLIVLGLIRVSDEFLFSGTSLLIMVGVGLDTVKQIESQLQQRNYTGFLR